MSEPKGHRLNPARDKRGLTEPQAVFADNVIPLGIQAASELAHPDASPESQRVMAYQDLSHPLVSSTISDIAESKGLTKQNCVEAIKNGLAATKPYGKEGIEHDDHPSRLKAAELGLKLHGYLRDSAIAIPVPVTKEQYVDLCRAFWGSKPCA